MQMGERHHVDVTGLPTERAEHLKHRTAVGRPERQPSVDRTKTGVDQQCAPATFYQQATGTHQHRVVLVEQIGPRLPLLGSDLREEPRSSQRDHAIDDIGQRHITPLQSAHRGPITDPANGR